MPFGMGQRACLGQVFAQVGGRLRVLGQDGNVWLPRMVACTANTGAIVSCCSFVPLLQFKGSKFRDWVNSAAVLLLQFCLFCCCQQVCGYDQLYPKLPGAPCS